MVKFYAQLFVFCNFLCHENFSEVCGMKMLSYILSPRLLDSVAVMSVLLSLTHNIQECTTHLSHVFAKGEGEDV